MTAIYYERGVLSAPNLATVAGMERTMWSDERLDDLALRMDAGFERVDRDIRELRTDMRDMRTLLYQLWGSTMVAFLCTIATVLVTNT
jgi:hypothetical protein